jgi:hypothetical protein
MLALALCLLAFAPAPQHQKLSASEAKDHIGETATVCGDVVSTRYAASTKGQPTFLNLDKPYPNQIFTVLIWGSNRSKFGTPEVTTRGSAYAWLARSLNTEEHRRLSLTIRNS